MGDTRTAGDACLLTSPALARWRTAWPSKGARAVWIIGLFAMGLNACAGTSDPHGADAPPPRELRLVSYNIRHGHGMDGVLDLARTAEVLRALDPDVVLLQEVDEACRRSGGVDQAAQLGAALGLEHRFAPFMDHDGGRYGLAILARGPIVDSRVIALPAGRLEPRAALEVTVRVAGEDVRFACAHLDWLPESGERLAQAGALWDALLEDDVTSPLVLGGDLNDEPTSATLALLQQTRADAAHLTPLQPLRSEHTFPADTPQKTIDYVLCGPPERWRDSTLEVVAEPRVSDHRPILARLVLR